MGILHRIADAIEEKEEKEEIIKLRPGIDAWRQFEQDTGMIVLSSYCSGDATTIWGRPSTALRPIIKKVYQKGGVTSE